MSTFQSFEELEVWQKARQLCRENYRISKQHAFSHDFVLRDQIRKASVSILCNISEGFERSGSREFLQFLSIAKGSAGEIRSQLCIALDQGYIDEDTYFQLSALASEVGRMLGGMINYLRKSTIRGSKYK